MSPIPAVPSVQKAGGPGPDFAPPGGGTSAGLRGIWVIGTGAVPLARGEGALDAADPRDVRAPLARTSPGMRARPRGGPVSQPSRPLAI